MNAPAMLPKGTHFARLAIALASTRKDAMLARDLAEARWGVASPVAQILRSAVASGSIGDPVWAGALAPYQVIASEFIEALRPQTILGRMAGMRRLPLNVRVLRATAGTSVGWVGAGAPAPVSRMALDTLVFDVLKIACIVVCTEELSRFSSPAAEALIRSDLLAAAAHLSDQSFIDPTFAGASGVAPAAITYGAPTIASSGITASAARADLKALLRLVTTNLVSPYLITDRRTGIALSLMEDGGGPVFPGAGANGGEIAGIPLLTSASVPSPVTADSPPLPASNIILLDAAEILLGDEGEVTIDLSDQASVQMESAPDSPITASIVQVSLWQNNLTA